MNEGKLGSRSISILILSARGAYRAILRKSRPVAPRSGMNGFWTRERTFERHEDTDDHAIDPDQRRGIGRVVTFEWSLEGKVAVTNRTLMREYSGRIALVNYDRTTIALHWLTVALVIVLFALAESWGFLRHGIPLRKELQSLHISLGILLTVALAVRLGWRVTRGRRLPAAVTGLQELAAKAMHYALYLLLTVQVILGFLYRWAQADSFMFFGLFPIQF